MCHFLGHSVAGERGISTTEFSDELWIVIGSEGVGSPTVAQIVMQDYTNEINIANYQFNLFRSHLLYLHQTTRNLFLVMVLHMTRSSSGNIPHLPKWQSLKVGSVTF